MSLLISTHIRHFHHNHRCDHRHDHYHIETHYHHPLWSPHNKALDKCQGHLAHQAHTGGTIIMMVMVMMIKNTPFVNYHRIVLEINLIAPAIVLSSAISLMETHPIWYSKLTSTNTVVALLIQHHHHHHHHHRDSFVQLNFHFGDTLL